MNESKYRIKTKLSGRRYEILDVYNNGHDLGGKLQTIFDRHLVWKESGAVSVTESTIHPKMARRKLFNDCTLRIGLMVRMVEHFHEFG